jgi:deazaflavin-dependent oxidoreductase (nitroreductase family)
MSEMNDFNAQVIDEFRANQGVVGGPFEGSPMILVHHVGAKSGADYIAPLVYLPDGDSYVIFASKGGAPSHPAWYHNLLAHPDVTVEVGAETLPATASEVTGEQRDALFAAQVQDHPQFAEYAEKTAGIRTIPVIRLTPAR